MKARYVAVLGLAVLAVLLVTVCDPADTSADESSAEATVGDPHFDGLYSVHVVVDPDIYINGGNITCTEPWRYTMDYFVSESPITLQGGRDGCVQFTSESDITSPFSPVHISNLGKSFGIGVMTPWYQLDAPYVGYGNDLQPLDPTATTASTETMNLEFRIKEVRQYELEYVGLPEGVSFPAAYDVNTETFVLPWMDDLPDKRFRGWQADFLSRADFDIPVDKLTFDGRYASSAVITAVWTPISVTDTGTVQLPPVQAEPPAPSLKVPAPACPEPSVPETSDYVPIVVVCSVLAVFLCAVVALRHRS